MGDDLLKVDYGDGVSALDRVLRSITMMMDGAISELISLKYDRTKDHIDILDPNEHDDNNSWYVTFRGRKVFAVTIDKEDGLAVVGRWIDKPRKRSFIDFLLRRKAA
jgi:hypothetical protein